MKTKNQTGWTGTPSDPCVETTNETSFDPEIASPRVEPVPDVRR